MSLSNARRPFAFGSRLAVMAKGNPHRSMTATSPTPDSGAATPVAGSASPGRRGLLRRLSWPWRVVILGTLYFA
ncbi:MAG: hypothetical protein ACREER_02755, partial [Alphaproteobacteria bacterium]